MNRRPRSSRGSVLLITLALIVAAAVIAYTVYGLAMETYRTSMRNNYLFRARALANSEMDFIFFRIKQAMIAQARTAGDVPAALSDICETSDPGDDLFVPTISRDPFSLAARSAAEGWAVRRSIVFDFTASGSIGTQTAVFSYFTVKVEVRAENSPFGPVSVRIGRRMNTSTSSIFQYNIFAQGDLEFAPGGHVTINGDIAANGSIYMGAATTVNADGSDSTLVINAYVRYLDGRTFDTSRLASGTAIRAPIWGTGQAEQVRTMDQPENLLGGLSASDIAANHGVAASGDGVANPNYNALFGNIGLTVYDTPDPAQLADAVNRVYRSVITPPPNAAYVASQQVSNGSSYLTDYPDADSAGGIASIQDDPSIAALRAYNRAGLILTVNGDGTYKITKGADSATDVSSDFPGILTAKTMYDLREQKDVAVTEVDVGVLKTKLHDNYPAFNGLLYVYLANSTAAHPAAIRLKNGAAVPIATQFDHGFSVATNGGLYVQGDYNTVPVTDPVDGSSVTYPAMLMADAITILSSSWNDANVTAQPGDSADVIAAKHDPMSTFYSSRVAAAGTTTVGAGLLTGNITKDSSGDYIYSGGGHNLIRFLENWHGSNVNFYGSIGRLFESTQFTAPFRAPNDATRPGTYNVPGDRTFTFDSYLKTHSPYGTPSVTRFDRGTIYTW